MKQRMTPPWRRLSEEERNRRRNLKLIQNLGRMTLSRRYWRARCALSDWLDRRFFHRDVYRLLDAALLVPPRAREDRAPFDPAAGLRRLRDDLNRPPADYD